MKTETLWDACCVRCGDVITSPICAECLEKEMEAWLQSRAPKLVPIIRSFVAAEKTGEELTHCILCGEHISSCGFCFTKDVLAFLEEQQPELIESFMEHFGYGGQSLAPPDEFIAM
ncbi:MAG: hypothetical protein ABIG95_06110 [Candidatus Woesearchaeota archaeon]